MELYPMELTDVTPAKWDLPLNIVPDDCSTAGLEPIVQPDIVIYAGNTKILGEYGVL